MTSTRSQKAYSFSRSAGGRSLRPTIEELAGQMGGARSWREARVFTVGHSTRTLDELVAMLRAFVNRLIERFGRTLEHDQRTFYAFPSAEVVADARIDSLGRCGMSRQKADTLRRVARAIASGELNETRLAHTSGEEAIRLLCELPGVGPWSAGLVLLRGLGRLDVFPPGDVGATRGLGSLMGLWAGSSLSRVVERFGDQRGYLSSARWAPHCWPVV